MRTKRDRLDAADRGRRQFHGSVLLEALACELQGAAVLGHRSDDVVRCARGYSRLDLDCHGDLRPHQADKVGNYLIGDAAGITADSSWINDHRAMKAIRSSGDRLTWGGAIAGRNGLAARSLGGLSAGRRSWPQCGVDSLLPHRDICLNKDSAKAIDRTDYLLSATQATISDYVEGFKGAGGILLFVNANRPSDGMTLADIGPAIADGEEVHEPEVEMEWTADVVPEQVRLVDLLQFLLRPPFLSRRRRLAVVVSAWDAVLAPKPSPEQWLRRELPLLDQFLANNPESFDVRIYGVSAQGGDVAGDQRTTLLRMTPSERIECVGPETDPHDLTAPIIWLTGDD